MPREGDLTGGLTGRDWLMRHIKFAQPCSVARKDIGLLSMPFRL